MFLLAGVLVLAGAGCSNKSLTEAQNQTNTNSTNLCGPTKEIFSTNALTNELKSIFNEAGSEVKLTVDIGQNSQTGDTLVYVWKNKPTVKKLESAFKNHGYTVKISGEALLATKGNTALNISLADATNCQKIIVSIISTALKPGEKTASAVSTEECAESVACFQYASYFLTAKNDPADSALLAKKCYDQMDALGIKYSMTRDNIEKACRAKINEPGFNDEVTKQKQKLGL